MEIYNIHFKNTADNVIQLLFTLHNSSVEEKQEDVIGTIMGNNLNDAKRRLVKILDREL